MRRAVIVSGLLVGGIAGCASPPALIQDHGCAAPTTAFRAVQQGDAPHQALLAAGKPKWQSFIDAEGLDDAATLAAFREAVSSVAGIATVRSRHPPLTTSAESHQRQIATDAGWRQLNEARSAPQTGLQPRVAGQALIAEQRRMGPWKLMSPARLQVQMEFGVRAAPDVLHIDRSTYEFQRGADGHWRLDAINACR